MKKTIIIATIKPWNIKLAEELKNEERLEYEIIIISSKQDLDVKKIEVINPEYIFFPHWSWIIPKEIFSNYNCIVFHTADLPYGRGGSPIQNLITRKIYKTKISALKVDDGIDTGDIYLKKEIDISKGSLEEILIEISEKIYKEMIPEILFNTPKPKKQTGEILEFKRRKISESNLNENVMKTLSDIYDFIRMLDAEEYPNAFINYQDFKIIFNSVSKKNGKLIGQFEILKKEGK